MAPERTRTRFWFNATRSRTPFLSLLCLALFVYMMPKQQVPHNQESHPFMGQKPRMPALVQERAKPLRIFVYDLPSKFTLGPMLSTYRWGYCSCCESFYGNEVDYHKYLLSSEIRTRNPEEANLFYVPVYTGCLIKGGDRIRVPQSSPPDAFFPNVSAVREVLDAAISDIRSRYPFWDRHNGSSHIWLFTQGFGAELFSEDAWTQAQNGMMISNNGQLSERRYRKGLDVTVPGKVRTGSTFSIEAESVTDIFSSRSTPIYFGGTVMNDARYSGGIRQELLHLHSQGILPRGVNVSFSSEKWDDIYTPMRSSIFCLCLEGWWAWTPRPFESIMQGCIPVVVSDDLELPFEELIPWREFSLKLSPARGILAIVSHLLSIPQREIKVLQQGILKFWPFFSYRAGGKAYELIDVMIKKRANAHSRIVDHESLPSEWSPGRLKPLSVRYSSKYTGSKVAFEIFRENGVAS